MSIFNSHIPAEVACQLKAREKIISQWDGTNAGGKNRDNLFLQYTTTKNSWVRLQSFVDYDSYTFDFKNLTNNKATVEKDGKYTGNQLAKKYVLEGGTLYNTSQLRAGIGSNNSVYLSDIDKRGISGTATLPLGVRPMPGITSVEVTNKSAYGSLREAVVNFQCWDSHQLEELEVLYMRVGYTCLLEWGWSTYLTTSGEDNTAQKSNLNRYPDTIKINNETTTIDAFDETQTENDIYNDLLIKASIWDHCYDGMLGYVKNFSWQLMPNGGYQCSTTLISRGEVIETLKASSNPLAIAGSTLVPADKDDPVPNHSLFEKIFLNLIGYTNGTEFYKDIATGEITKPTGSFYDAMFDAGSAWRRTDLEKINENVYKDINTQIKKAFDNGQLYYQNMIRGSSYNQTINAFDASDTNDSLYYDNYLDLNRSLIVHLIEGGTDQGSGIEYIPLPALLAILNIYFVPKDPKTKEPIVNIILPWDQKILKSIDTVSIDIQTCFIHNYQATFICDSADGFNMISGSYAPIKYDSTDPDNFSLRDVSGGMNQFGDLESIYVSMNKIIQIYRGLSGGPDGVDIIQFLQKLMDEISFALGGINDFKIFNENSSIQIIDVKYLGDIKSDETFRFDLMGLKSICRDVKMNSRIFSEQSSMMAIGAMSGNQNDGVANLGDLYTSTQNYFNLGLTDRLKKATFDTDPAAYIEVGGKRLTGNKKYYFELYQNIANLSHYLHRNCIGLDTMGDDIVTARLPQPNEIINASSLLKTCLYHFEDDVDFKALIPFELEITLDGISGFVVGQIFTVDKSILPKDYYNKNLGFVIIGVSHSLQNNDWITTLKTQIVLLENDKIPSFGVDKNDLKKIINEIKEEANKANYLFMALADLLVHITLDAMSHRYDPTYSGTKGGSLHRLFDLTSAASIQAFVGTGADGSVLFRKDIATYLGANEKFIGASTKVENYLKNWFEHVKNNVSPKPKNFPATYDEFTKVNILGTNFEFKADEFCKTVFGFPETNAPNATGFIMLNTGITATDNPAYHKYYFKWWESSFWDRAMKNRSLNEILITTGTTNVTSYSAAGYAGGIDGIMILSENINQIDYNSSIKSLLNNSYGPHTTLTNGIGYSSTDYYGLKDNNSLLLMWNIFRDWLQKKDIGDTFFIVIPSSAGGVDDVHIERLKDISAREVHTLSNTDKTLITL